jgi:signal transduction histidine kinase
MQDHHGDIRVTSELGRGTTVTLVVPLRLEEILRQA